MGPAQSFSAELLQWQLAQQQISRSTAITRALSAYPGRVLSANLKTNTNGSAYYFIKILSGSDVRVIRVNAATGSLQ